MIEQYLPQTNEKCYSAFQFRTVPIFRDLNTLEARIQGGLSLVAEQANAKSTGTVIWLTRRQATVYINPQGGSNSCWLFAFQFISIQTRASIKDKHSSSLSISTLLNHSGGPTICIFYVTPLHFCTGQRAPIQSRNKCVLKPVLLASDEQSASYFLSLHLVSSKYAQI